MRVNLVKGLVLLLSLATMAPTLYRPTGSKTSAPKYEISDVPFAAGEVFEYCVSWNGIPAANSVTWVERCVQDGTDLYEFQMITKSNSVIDILFDVHETARSTVDAKTLLPIRHDLIHQLNDRQWRYTAVFDHTARMARCQRAIVHKDRIEKVRLSFQNAYDPISLPYFLRTLAWKVGDARQLELVEDNTRFLFTMMAVGQEEISVPAGKFRAIQFELTIRNLTTRRKEEAEVKRAEVWASDDRYHIPLRLKTGAFIGHIYADLAKFKLASGETPPSLCQ